MSPREGIITGAEVLAAIGNKLDPYRAQPRLPQDLAHELRIANGDVAQFMAVFSTLLEAAQAVTRRPSPTKRNGKWHPDQFRGSGMAEVRFSTYE